MNSSDNSPFNFKFLHPARAYALLKAIRESRPLHETALAPTPHKLHGFPASDAPVMRCCILGPASWPLRSGIAHLTVLSILVVPVGLTEEAVAKHAALETYGMGKADTFNFLKSEKLCELEREKALAVNYFLTNALLSAEYYEIPVYP